jgi:hypothetical protein
MKKPNYLLERKMFYTVLLFIAAGILMMIGALIARDEQKLRQAERLATYDWYDEDCLTRRDINWILHGINE